VKPAWSWQFEPEHLKDVRPLDLDEPITRSWAWEGSEGEGVKVGIVDSGIDETHPLVGPIQGSVALEWDPEEGDVVTKEVPHEDVFGHGTACAAIIRSLAPKCEIYSIRVLGKRLTGKGVVFAEGIQWAIDNGIDVVNLSLSTGKRDYFELFHEIVDAAYFNNTMLVAAINNVPNPSYPSEYAGVFSVAAHDGKDPYSFDYNPQGPVEFGAPGIDLEVAWLNGETIEATGNSFAAPHIAGLVTKVLGKHPGLTPFQMKTILHAIADNSTT
jgi:subtilisin